MILIERKKTERSTANLASLLKKLLDTDKTETLKPFRNVLFMKRLPLGIYQRRLRLTNLSEFSKYTAESVDTDKDSGNDLV